MKLKETLKQLKPHLPPTLQRLGSEYWRTIEISLLAALERRKLIEAQRIVLPVEGVADFERSRILGPAKGQVLVRTIATVLSPGTERAQLLGLTSPRLNFPLYPGYSGCGEVIAVGRNVQNFKVGELVAGRIKHGSPDVAATQWLFHVPSQVPAEYAAFIELGIIVLQGIRKARIRPGESILVLGQGLIGQLANRICRLSGGAPVVAVASSRTKSLHSLVKGGADRFVTVEELRREMAGDRFDVVIEATGDASALSLATSMARTGGRVALLGSPRSAAILELGQSCNRSEITLIGAHITGMPERDTSSGLWTYQDEGRLFLDLLAQDKLKVDDLITHRCPPAKSAEIYDALPAADSKIIGLVFDWSECSRAGGLIKTEKDLIMGQNNPPSFQFARRWGMWKADFVPTASIENLPLGKRLRVGVVGGGDIGLRNAKSVHASSSALVTAVYDANPEVLKDLAGRLGAPATLDYETLLSKPDVDAVLLSVPHMLHAPMAIQAAGSGKHIMLEKPMGVNLDDATRIIESCRQAGVRLTVNFSFRYLPVIQLAREVVQEGLLGEICGSQINHLTFKGANYWSGGYTARSPASWRGSREKAGGGILIMGICHALDYLRYITGLEITRAYSEYGTFASPVEVEDGIAVNYHYDNGALGSVTASTCWRATPAQEVRIWGTHGTLTIHNNNRLTLWSARRWRQLSPAKEHEICKLPQIDYTARWVQNFAVAIANNMPHEITGKDGWLNNAIVEASYCSRDAKHPVEVKTFPWADEI